MLPVVVAGGCQSPESDFEQASRAVFRQSSWTAIMDAGEQTMHEFFTVDLVDRRSGLIRSAPTDASPAHRESPIGAALSSPPEVRRIAEMEFQRQAMGVGVSCRVLIQRNQAGEARAYRQQSSINDMPNQTPLEESMGMESGPGVTWTTVDRDRGLEQAVLAALRERLSGTAPASNPTSE